MCFSSVRDRYIFRRTEHILAFSGLFVECACAPHRSNALAFLRLARARHSFASGHLQLFAGAFTSSIIDSFINTKVSSSSHVHLHRSHTVSLHQHRPIEPRFLTTTHFMRHVLVYYAAPRSPTPSL